MFYKNCIKVATVLLPAQSIFKKDVQIKVNIVQNSSSTDVQQI